MRGVAGILGILGVLVATTAVAMADVPVIVFPLSAGKLPAGMAKVPEKLTAALARSINAEVASVSMDDAAGLNDCDPEATSCIVLVSRTMKAKRVVFGSITTIDDGVLKVTLTRFDPGPERQQRTFELSSTTADAMAEELPRLAAPLLGSKAGKIVQPGSSDTPIDERSSAGKPEPVHKTTPKVSKRSPETDGADDPRNQDDKPPGPISGTTWGILGAGGFVAIAGITLVVQANGIANEVRAAPHDTLQDFANLRALEAKGQNRQRLGGVVAGAGLIAIGYGIYRLISEREASPADASAMHLTPVPIEGGAALVFTMGMP